MRNLAQNTCEFVLSGALAGTNLKLTPVCALGSFCLHWHLLSAGLKYV